MTPMMPLSQMPLAVWFYLLASVGSIPALIAAFPELRPKRVWLHLVGALLLTLLLGGMVHAAGTDPQPTITVLDPCNLLTGVWWFLAGCAF